MKKMYKGLSITTLRSQRTWEIYSKAISCKLAKETSPEDLNLRRERFDFEQKNPNNKKI